MPTTPARPINKPPLIVSLFALFFAVVEAEAVAAATPPLEVLLATLTAPLEPVAVVPPFVGAEYADDTAREMAELVVVVYTDASLQ